MDPARFLLIRHGESTWNAAGRWQGHGNPPLSPRGRDQVSRLARALAPVGVDAIVSSDLLRARQTAALLAAALDLDVATDARLRELDVGTWTGCTRAQIAARDAAALARFDGGARAARAGGGETRDEVRSRAQRALADCAARHPGRLVAVVCHLGVVRALLPGTDLENAGWCAARGPDLLPRPVAAGAAP
jgi:probable phosphoglycerate mutase